MNRPLVDLEPRWIRADGRGGMGVTFDCPHCIDAVRRLGAAVAVRRLGVFFANPIDGGPPASSPEVSPLRWQRTGDTFETLTVMPSVDASKDGHWHGFVTNGEVTGC